jgi:RNA polymerase sigma-70 factor (ECF subfamily)
MNEPDKIATFEQHRPLLFSIAYRMLGSAMEAEDMVQETYLRYQAVPEESILTPRPFLTTIITRLCLDQLKSARSQREQYIGPWLPEPIRTDVPGPAASMGDVESISMAFLILLESLSPAERAVFLLREVFDHNYAEIAQVIGKSEEACRQLFSRARKHIVAHRPRFKSTPEQHRRILTRFIEAVSEGDLDGLTQMLADDVVFTSDGGGRSVAVRRPVAGRETVARLFLALAKRNVEARLTLEIIEANGKTALLLRSPDGQPFGLLAMETAQGKIQCFSFVVNPDKLKHV